MRKSRSRLVRKAAFSWDGHELRFEPAVIEMRQRVSAGEFGNPLMLEGNFSQDKFLKLPDDNWRLSNTANRSPALRHRDPHGGSFHRPVAGRQASGRGWQG